MPTSHQPQMSCDFPKVCLAAASTNGCSFNHYHHHPNVFYRLPYSPHDSHNKNDHPDYHAALISAFVPTLVFLILHRIHTNFPPFFHSSSITTVRSRSFSLIFSSIFSFSLFCLLFPCFHDTSWSCFLAKTTALPWWRVQAVILSSSSMRRNSSGSIRSVGYAEICLVSVIHRIITLAIVIQIFLMAVVMMMTRVSFNIQRCCRVTIGGKVNDMIEWMYLLCGVSRKNPWGNCGCISFHARIAWGIFGPAVNGWYVP